ncbi:hypothetical protein [Nocardia sp. NPDC019255]|uniref:hypothetical protein n=1 Tax=Nocardia sp. NPDC019255 TaxID=3154591 RepID=UPI0033EDB455
MGENDVHGRFATVVVGEYLDPKLNLPDIGEHAARVATVLRNIGFAEDHREGGSSAAEIQGWLADWQPSSQRLLLYWTGHAQNKGSDIALYGSDYHIGNPLTKVSGHLLTELLTQRSVVEIVVIIDACHSGVGVKGMFNAFDDEVEHQAFTVNREPGLAVLSSARAGEYARDGVFAAALEHILWEGPPSPTDTYSGWTDHDELITPTQLYAALRVHLKRNEARQQPDFSQRRAVNGFFRNRHYRPRRPDATVETVRHRAFIESDLLEHFLAKFRGIDTPNADGWYYTPRPGPQARITEWLSTDDGVLVITGPPGSGKSALLGWLAAMSTPGYRRHTLAKTGHPEDIVDLPAEHSVDAGIHAKQRSLQECVTYLGQALELTPPADGWLEPGPLIEQITALAEHDNRTITILLDALDEALPADQARIAVDLLAALSHQPRVKVIVGTRPNREDPDRHSGSEAISDGAWTADGPLIRALTTNTDQVLRLDTDPGSTHAITTYTTNRLLDPTTSPYRDNHDLAAATAAMIAAHSDGIFLFARLIARSLINRTTPLDLNDPDTPALFNGGVAQAFDNDLLNYGTDYRRVYDLLAPLAWAEGSGLPRRDIWLTLANALSRPGVTYTDTDIAWVLEHAGAHIIESGEDGQTVYRLYHQAFNDYFQHNIDNTWVQATITHALLELTYPT